MGRRIRDLVVATALALVCLPADAFAQTGNVAGTVRDATGAVIPGVTVEVTSPQLIEKVRSTVTDENGRDQIASLPVGIYKVTFTLTGFATLERSNIELSSDFTESSHVSSTGNFGLLLRLSRKRSACTICNGFVEAGKMMAIRSSG